MAALAFSGTNGKQIGAKGGILGGMKSVIGELTCDTDYPDDGYTQAQLIALAGLSGFHSIVAVVPLGPVVAGSGETGYIVGWDCGTKTLRIYNAGGGASTDPIGEVATGLDALDGLKASLWIIGT